ncbi:MAG: MerR family transcriptional regulator [Oscillospiraceae bacterium]|nr:MerR family transcriptional regulator [Oscillospiraceae bacterium]
MKINELSKITHVNSETIRMYRNKGLLFPVQNENGYYEYSEADLQDLLFIRKLRGMNLSLDTVAETYEQRNVDEVIRGFCQDLNDLEEQIARLQKRQAMLRMHVEFYEAYRENTHGVAEVEIPDDRYDLVFDPARVSPELDVWLEHIALFTQGLYIPEELLQREPLPSAIPVKHTIGSFAPILEENHFPVPSDAIFTPRGHYLTAKVILRAGEETLAAAQLQPLTDYAAANGFRLRGDSTAFLFRIDHTERTARHIYRIRVRIEKESG